MKHDVLIAGVGGQGNLFASRILSTYALEKGLNVVGTETVGAAQRGGSVVSHVRISDGPVFSPLIPRGGADVILGFEAIEMLRHMRLSNPDTVYILNMFKIPTAYVLMGIDEYPADEQILAAAKRACKRGYVVNATEVAMKLGNVQVMNVVMVGALTQVDPFFPGGELRKVLEEVTPARFKAINLEAFDAGRELIKAAN
ncbi:MAG: indolepyruvate oxidoreductase subunit beta [Candidatus Bathyarchaeia archaeon]